jgi:hypothetical protein
MSDLLDQLILDEKRLAEEIGLIKGNIDAAKLSSLRLGKSIEQLKVETKQKEEETEHYLNNSRKTKIFESKIGKRKCARCNIAFNFLCQKCKCLTCGKCNTQLSCTHCMPGISQNWLQIKYDMNNI